MPRPTNSETTTETVYHRLREMIVDARLRPGERLVQRKLADYFQTSNIPVVEAIRRLERDGLVDNRAKWGGAQVKVWGLEDVRGLYLARAALEGVACRLFAESASAEARERLKELSSEFDRHCIAGDYAAGIEADIQFHLHIVRGANSPILSQMLENSWLITTAIRNSFKHVPLYSGPIGIHEPLATVLISGDGEAAEQAGKAHVMHALGWLMERCGPKDAAVSN